jgi:hypothetical protein
LANFPGVIADGEEVIFTEKLHGKNCRVGLVLDDGQWTWMAGSHGQRRKEVFTNVRRFVNDQLVAQLVLQSPQVAVGQVFAYDGGKFWQVIETEKTFSFKAAEVYRTGTGEFGLRVRRSEFWEPLTDTVKAMLEHVRDRLPWPEPKAGIVLFGEATGTQDMKYGLKNVRGFRAFDLAVNGRYLDFDVKKRLCEQFNVETVPTLYRGPFSAELVAQHTDGPTTMCAPEEAGAFGGREGIVVTPAVERIEPAMMPTGTRGRVIFKSISADYLARRDGTDSH